MLFASEDHKMASDGSVLAPESWPRLNINFSGPQHGSSISECGPNNVNPGQSASIGNDTSQNANNVSTCCVNGRCCVSTDGGPAICTP